MRRETAFGWREILIGLPEAYTESRFAHRIAGANNDSDSGTYVHASSPDWRLRLILVTGGAGFIGSNFVLQWIATESDPLVNLDKLTYAGNPENLSR